MRSAWAVILLAAMVAVRLAQPSLASGEPWLAGVQPANRAASPDILPFDVAERTLPNGLRVVVVPTGFPNLVSIRIPVQTGSRNELEAGKSGFAHFFEHLMFRGTSTMTPERQRQILSKAGARSNAGTGDDDTVYYATFAKEDLEPVLAMYADMFQNLSYSEADFKTEARAILGEYNKNSAEPFMKLFEAQRERFYKVHPYKHTTMGFIRDIENMPNEYEYSKQFYARWYRPDLTTVVIAGDVTASDTLPLVEKLWGRWRAPGEKPPAIPREPEPSGAQYVHVTWDSPTLPLVTVGLPAPAFDETGKDAAALDMISALYFGTTSDLYKKLVVRERTVDELFADAPESADPSLFTIVARVKLPANTLIVRDDILATLAQIRSEPIAAQRLADAKSFRRYSFTRSLDSTERVASVVTQYVAHRRSFATLNNYFRAIESLTPADLQAAARKYFVDPGVIVTTLSHDPLPSGIERVPALSAVTPARTPAAASSSTSNPGRPAAARAATSAPSLTLTAAPAIPVLLQRSPLPQLTIKMLFAAGSAHDPAGKEGLASLTAAMIAEAGSKAMSIEDINAALYPMAAALRWQVDKEMTVFTASVHRDYEQALRNVMLPQLVDPGFREEDFLRLRESQLNELTHALRSDNEEELAREQLQINIYKGSPYGHTTLGTVAGLNAITLDDVKQFAREMYTKANLRLAISGDASETVIDGIQRTLTTLPEGRRPPRPQVAAERVRPGVDVEIIQKETRATAISLGFPIEVTRSHRDFAALSVARAWLGEHRESSGQLYQRMRQIRGLNYGDYAYIEAFPRGMFQFFPDANIARQRQAFEIWIRPVVPENAHMAIRIAMYELQQLVDRGMTAEQFEATRDYLLKNVYVATARQDVRLGYALDSQWYGIQEFTAFMREGLRALTLEKVNGAIRQHLSSTRMSMVIVSGDAAALKEALAGDGFSAIRYDGEKPKPILDEDKLIGGMKLGIEPERIRITPVNEVFAK